MSIPFRGHSPPEEVPPAARRKRQAIPAEAAGHSHRAMAAPHPSQGSGVNQHNRGSEQPRIRDPAVPSPRSQPSKSERIGVLFNLTDSPLSPNDSHQKSASKAKGKANQYPTNATILIRSERRS
jgi:hypothetical protein